MTKADAKPVEVVMLAAVSQGFAITSINYNWGGFYLMMSQGPPSAGAGFLLAIPYLLNCTT